jgi:hypothetical protein
VIIIIGPLSHHRMARQRRRGHQGIRVKASESESIVIIVLGSESSRAWHWQRGGRQACHCMMIKFSKPHVPSSRLAASPPQYRRRPGPPAAARRVPGPGRRPGGGAAAAAAASQSESRRAGLPPKPAGGPKFPFLA